MADAIVLTFDRSKRRRPTASCISATYRRLLDYEKTRAELERRRSETRLRVAALPLRSHFRAELHVEIDQINADIRLVEELIRVEADNVVEMRRPRRA